MTISLKTIDPEVVLQQLKQECSQPFGQVDQVAVLRLAAQLCAAGLDLPGGLVAVEVPWGGVVPAVRSLLAGQTTHAGPLSVLGLDGARTEGACTRVERLRDALGVVQGLADPLRTTLQTEASGLQGEAKGRYDTVRSLTAVPEVAKVLQTATDHFYGPAKRGTQTRAVARRAVDRAHEVSEVPTRPTPVDGTLLTVPTPTTLAASPARRRTRRG